jgi:hypothetical protein
MIREFRASDEPILRKLHAEQGFDYEFPDLTAFEAVLVAVDENDLPVQAVAARKTVEVYMLGDPKWRTPAWRFDVLKLLHEGMHRLLLQKGFTDAHCWIPPVVDKAFGRRLVKQLGWVRSRWQSYCRYL